ncbi:hypothetical protein Tco_0648898 [Tanacetum coccineum]
MINKDKGDCVFLGLFRKVKRDKKWAREEEYKEKYNEDGDDVLLGVNENDSIEPKDDPIERKVNDWEFKGLFGVLLIDNVEEQRNMRGKRLAISMVEEAWLSEKEEV